MRESAGCTAARPRTAAAGLRAAARATALRHASWLAVHGPFSADPHDLWATTLGGRAKAFYYEHHLLGIPVVAPFMAPDLVAPRARAALWPRHRYPIADAHYVMGLLALGTGEVWQSRARVLLDALVDERCPGETDFCWGYPFDWTTCFGLWRAGTPFITSTPYVYEALEAAHEATRDDGYLGVMESIGRFAFARISGVEVAPGVKASTYSPYDRRKVVNASAYRGFLLAAAGTRFGRQDWLDEAAESLAFVVRVQRQDGSWLYAEDGRDAFIDNIHTCMVLKNLVKAEPLVPALGLADVIEAGWRYFSQNLLDAQGLPVSFARRQRPGLVRRDLYDYAETINLATLLTGRLEGAAGVAARVVAGLLADWVLPDGHFVTRLTVLGRNTVPYVRWGQSQVFRALALYARQGD